ncbi:CB1 cannabinoid receptor-interacting protein 1a [Menidia menidia]
MDDVPALVHLSVQLRVQPNAGPVFFKVDGARFGQSRTIKLLTGSKYRVRVAVSPGSVRAGNMNIGGVVFPLEQQDQDQDQDKDQVQVQGQDQGQDQDQVVYVGQYSTEGVPHTKSGDRQPVQVSIEFGPAGTFETVWQVKFYNYYKREHCQFGNQFSSIQYELKPNETRTLMWVNKEVFQ